ncbi:MAG: NAD-dependent epimerase/dehydratase family protein [Parcubacteria group bacterium]|jgi:UDP-glucose 4-epimerase
MKKINALITGGSGFIGSHLTDTLTKSGFNVTIFDIKKPTQKNNARVKFVRGDITNKNALIKALKNQDYVFHLAALMGTSELLQCSDRAVHINIEGTVNVLEACKKQSVKAIILSKPHAWLNTYTITKQAAEKFAWMYKNEFGIQVAIVKFFNVYGPNEPAGKRAPYRKAVPTFILNGLAGKNIEIYGDGKQTADFVYVTDAVRALAMVAKNWNKCEGKTLEAGSGIKTSVNNLASIIRKLTGNKSEIIHVPMRPGEISGTHVLAKSGLLKKITGWKCEVSFEDGLKQTIDWYKKTI